MLPVVSLMYANFVLEVQLNNRSSVRAVATGLVSPVSTGFLCRLDVHKKFIMVNFEMLLHI